MKDWEMAAHEIESSELRTASGRPATRVETLVIDNYDSFTYNLVQLLGQLGEDPVVVRNDQLPVEAVVDLGPARIIISPGPGTPGNAGMSEQVIRAFSGSQPILGVCLGHQAIGEVFGGDIVRAPELRHGKTSRIFHDGDALFRAIPDGFEATRYHSLVVKGETLPQCLKVTGWSEDGIIMAVRHREHMTFGVQFHPESVLTVHGITLLKNFLCFSS